MRIRCTRRSGWVHLGAHRPLPSPFPKLAGVRVRVRVRDERRSAREHTRTIQATMYTTFRRIDSDASLSMLEDDNMLERSSPTLLQPPIIQPPTSLSHIASAVKAEAARATCRIEDLVGACPGEGDSW